MSAFAMRVLLGLSDCHNLPVIPATEGGVSTRQPDKIPNTYTGDYTEQPPSVRSRGLGQRQGRLPAPDKGD